MSKQRTVGGPPPGRCLITGVPPRLGPPPGPARSRGFSLLEVLVAFVIMALTLGVLFQVFSTGLRTAVVSEEYGEATRLAESVLTEQAAIRPLVPGEYRGSLEGTPFRWQASITPMPTRDFAPQASETWQAMEITVRVSWPAGRGERELSLRTVRLERES